MKKRLFALTLSVMLIIAMALTAAADSNVAFDVMVIDMSEVLSQSEAAELHEKAWEITQRYKCAVYIVTTDDLEGYEPWEYSEALFDQLEMGYGEEQSCIILLLAMNSRDYDIMAHGYGNTAFTDYGKEVMADRFLDELGNNDWYGGFVEYINCCEEFLKLAEQGTPVDIDTEIDFVTALLISVVVAIVVAFIVCTILRLQMRSARRQTNARGYINDQGLVLTGRSDQFVHTTRIERYDPPKEKSGGTSINSHGSSHRGGKF